MNSVIESIMNYNAGRETKVWVSSPPTLPIVLPNSAVPAPPEPTATRR